MTYLLIKIRKKVCETAKLLLLLSHERGDTMRKLPLNATMSSNNTASHILQRLTTGDERVPIVMGILNCTPDSFYEGSRKQTEYEIASRADQILHEGGEIIDIGAFSTRPGADEVSQDEEMRRMSHALAIIRRAHPNAILSIDTYRPAVARMAVEEYGADIINDVSEGGITGIVDKPLETAEGEGDIPAMFAEVARLHVPYILMSVQAEMETMLQNFRKEVATLQALGVKDIILDPGYGFGKDVIKGNFTILRRQKEIKDTFPQLPLLAGMSRKRMIWQLLGGTAQDTTAMQGTMLANLVAIQNGADILRVHDVKEARATVLIANQLAEKQQTA